ncbi:MAG: uncharacterized protein A8A55_3539, partial [Amphiamblys sp. WSBS2006]
SKEKPQPKYRMKYYHEPKDFLTGEKKEEVDRAVWRKIFKGPSFSSNRYKRLFRRELNANKTPTVNEWTTQIMKIIVSKVYYRYETILTAQSIFLTRIQCYQLEQIHNMKHRERKFQDFYDIVTIRKNNLELLKTTKLVFKEIYDIALWTEKRTPKDETDLNWLYCNVW